MKIAVSLLLTLLCGVEITLAQAPEVRRAIPVGPAATLQEDQTDIDAAAQFIAGLPPSAPGPFADLSATPEWKAFAKTLDESWRQFDEFRLQPIREWRPG
ncbi:MAG: hypothetical protein PHQ12_13440, partial [Chthoniobacteraceae bacterium]|nr:hypothetical protein [Chthoniobacteraceae bacterium]